MSGRTSRRPASRRRLGSLRLHVLGVVALALFGMLFARLGQVQVQVLEPTTFERVVDLADTRVVVLPAVRGRILDRHGVPLAEVSLPAAAVAGNDLIAWYDGTSAYAVGNRQFHNYESRSYGPLRLQRAIEVSCDMIFYAFAYRSWLAQGGLDAKGDTRDPFVAAARAFGLGRPTGVDLPGEAAGRVPDRAWKLSTWATRVATCGRARTGYPEVARAEPTRAAYLTQLAVENCRTGFQLRAGDAANFAIGQGDVAVTPLQMADAFAGFPADWPVAARRAPVRCSGRARRPGSSRMRPLTGRGMPWPSSSPRVASVG